MKVLVFTKRGCIFKVDTEDLGKGQNDVFKLQDGDEVVAAMPTGLSTGGMNITM